MLPDPHLGTAHCARVTLSVKDATPTCEVDQLPDHLKSRGYSPVTNAQIQHKAELAIEGRLCMHAVLIQYTY